MSGQGEREGGHAPPDLPRVFINCPFDEAFEEHRDAIILACVGSGFYPTSAAVDGPGGTLRIDRIIDQLERSLLSIHDLSRTAGEGPENVARFNMPLELGMAMYLAHSQPGRHTWLALVPDAVSRDRLISDLNGFDPEVYNGSIDQLVHRVTSFLASQPAALPGTNPKFILAARAAYIAEKQRLQDEWIHRPLWAHLVAAAQLAFRRLGGSSPGGTAR